MSAINSMWPKTKDLDDLQKQMKEQYNIAMQARAEQRADNAALLQNSVPYGNVTLGSNLTISGSGGGGSGVYQSIPTPLIPEKFELTWENNKEGMWVAVSTSSRPHSHGRAFAVIRELYGKYYVMRELTGEMTSYDDLEMAKVFIESIHILEMN